MNEIEKLTSEVRRATDYQINRQILREKILTDLHVPFNGGLFLVTQELIAFVYAWQGTQDIWPWDGGQDMYIEDVYHNPIHIADRKEFYKIICQHYQQVMNTWHQQHAHLKKIRKI
jgi:hypothetical protein